MKTLIRGLIILAVFVLLAGVVTVSVNVVAGVAVSMGLIDSPEERAAEEAAREAASASEAPEPVEREAPEDFNLFAYVVQWIRSTGKNVFVVAIPVLAIVVPKSLMARLRKRS